MDDLAIERSFDSRTKWFIDMLGSLFLNTGSVLAADWARHWYCHSHLPPVINSYNQLADVFSTGAGIECLYCRYYINSNVLNPLLLNSYS